MANIEGYVVQPKTVEGEIIKTKTIQGEVNTVIGLTPDIQIGEIETLPASSEAYVELAEGSTKLHPIFNFGIPEGLQGPKGEPGAIKMQFLSELPEVGSSDTLYFIPAKEPSENNIYDEYSWVNKGTEEEPAWDWEHLGSPKVVIDLTDYAKKTELPTKTSQLTNDSDFITNDITTDFNLDGKLYLNTVGSSVNAGDSSRIIFGTSGKIYSYLASNQSGAFAFSKGDGNIIIYPKTKQYNCLMSDCDSDLGRTDKLWKNLDLCGVLNDGTNSVTIANIAKKDYVEEKLGDIESILNEVV